MLNKQFRKIQQFGVLVNLLRDRQGFLEEIRQEVRLQNKISSLFVSSSIFFAIYGAIVFLELNFFMKECNYFPNKMK